MAAARFSISPSHVGASAGNSSGPPSLQARGRRDAEAASGASLVRLALPTDSAGRDQPGTNDDKCHGTV